MDESWREIAQTFRTIEDERNRYKTRAQGLESALAETARERDALSRQNEQLREELRKSQLLNNTKD